MSRRWRLISLILATLLVGPIAAYVWLGGKPPRTLVRDDAGLLSTEQRKFVARYHAYLLADYGIDYRVVTARELEDINRSATDLFDDLVRSNASEQGRGLLLVIDAGANLVRLEVGYALEGIFPDAFAAYVEQRQMVPFFERNRVGDGILATTELIVDRAEQAVANAGFSDQVAMAGSGGAGATAPARIGAGRAARAAPAGDRRLAIYRTPSEALQAYFSAMAARDEGAIHAIYSPSAQRMLKDQVVTPAQMDTVRRIYRACRAEAALLSNDGDRAVIRYPPGERGCAPFFFERVGETWTIDAWAMQRAIRFGRSNAWHFDMSVDHAYRYAFEDWRFDRHGFPIATE